MTCIEAKAAVLRAYNSPFEIETVSVEGPRSDELRVRLVATGICHTDLIMAAGALRAQPPVVLGHEGAGVVEAVGDAVTTHQVGDHVVLTFAHCGHCKPCSDGAPTYCREFMPRNFGCSRPDGSSAFAGHDAISSHFFGQSSFATYAICNARNAVKVPKEVDLSLLGPLGCGVQTGAGAIMNALDVGAGASLAVFGSGAVGLSAIMAAKVVGATTIIAVDRNEARLAIAKDLGATHTVLATATDTREAILSVLPDGMDYTLDTTGVPEVVSTAIAVLAARGTCGLVAGAPGIEAGLAVNHLFSGGRSVRGVTEGDAVPSVFIPQLIELYRQGRFPFDRMVEFFPFEEINTAMAKGGSGEVVKPIIRF